MAERLLSNGVTLDVVDEGNGRPVVFIHGVMMSGRFFDAQVPALSPEHRVVVPTLRGHGDSEKTAGGHVVANYAADLHTLFGDAGIERPVLVGWSMGAMVAYEYLKGFGQDGVAGLVIVDQPPSDYTWPDGYEFGGISIEVLGELVGGLQMAQAAVAEEFAHLMQHRIDAGRTTWMVEEITKVPPSIATAILVDQTIKDYRPFLPEIRVPTLVLFGGDDKMTSPKAGQWIAAAIPGARFRVFDSSSHVPFIEEPEAFNAELLAFLDELAR